LRKKKHGGEGWRGSFIGPIQRRDPRAQNAKGKKKAKSPKGGWTSEKKNGISDRKKGTVEAGEDSKELRQRGEGLLPKRWKGAKIRWCERKKTVSRLKKEKYSFVGGIRTKHRKSFRSFLS